VAGYDPDALLDRYYNADGDTPTDKINSLRREIYAKNKDTINAQKRAARAKMTDEVTDEQYIRQKINSGEWGTKINKEKQTPHIENSRQRGKSYLFNSVDPQMLFDRYSGTGTIERDRKGRRTNKEIVTVDYEVGIDYNANERTNTFKIHHSRNRTHIVPTKKRK
jgi:hypothetical protein